MTGNRHFLPPEALFLEVVEGTLAINAWIFGHSQNALGNDVAHDFVRATGDTSARSSENQLIPCIRAPFATVGDQFWSEHHGHKITETHHVGGTSKFGNTHFRSGHLTRLNLVHCSLVVEVGDTVMDDDLGELITNYWVVV